MTEAQFTGIIRQALTLIGSFLTAYGYATAAQVETAVGAFAVLASLAWTLWTNRPTGLVNSASKLPQVEHIEVSSAKMADNVPSEKVTS